MRVNGATRQSLAKQPQLPLEIEFKELFDSDVDIHAKINFNDYLAPNELGVVDAAVFYQMRRAGILVSTGTERTFFGLALTRLAPFARLICEGLVVRDINPRVKAYNDFNVLLLRIAESMEDYAFLSEPGPENKEAVMSKIVERLDIAAMPPHVKAYYQRNLANISAVYFNVARNWRNQTNFLYYHKDLHHFDTLQSYARAGNIVTSIGKINDLHFLANRIVRIVDISNIWDYSVIDLQNGNSDFSPTVIWTWLTSGNPTNYYSYQHVWLASEDRMKLELLFTKVLSSWPSDMENREEKLVQDIKFIEIHKKRADDLDAYLPIRYAFESLELVQDYIDAWIHCSPFGIFNFSGAAIHRSVAEKFNQLDIRTLEAIAREPGIQRFGKDLVDLWPYMDTDKYLAFSGVSGWKEEFLAAAEADTIQDSLVERYYIKELGALADNL
jgi:hypothetical protein